MLSSKLRWCLTGTPIQNRLEDLAALVSFIHCSPLDNIHEFRKHIITPVMQSEDQGVDNIRNLLDSICLRRTKKLLNLPQIIYEDRRIDFTAKEKAYYTTIQAEKIAMIKKNESQGRGSKDFGMLQLHLQLRRICNHGTFHKQLSSAAEDRQFEPEQALATKKKKCEHCKKKIVGVDGMENDERTGKFSSCGHLFCTDCYLKYKEPVAVSTEEVFHCPICKERVSSALHGESRFKHNSNQTLVFAEDGISSKVSALMDDIKLKSSEGKR